MLSYHGLALSMNECVQTQEAENQIVLMMKANAFLRSCSTTWIHRSVAVLLLGSLHVLGTPQATAQDAPVFIGWDLPVSHFYVDVDGLTGAEVSAGFTGATSIDDISGNTYVKVEEQPRDRDGWVFLEGLSTGTTTLTVTARNSHGTTTADLPVKVVARMPRATNVSVTPGSGKLDVSWSLTTGNTTDCPISEINVTAREKQNISNLRIVTVAPDVTKATVSELLPETTYDVSVFLFSFACDYAHVRAEVVEATTGPWPR